MVTIHLLQSAQAPNSTLGIASTLECDYCTVYTIQHMAYTSCAEYIMHYDIFKCEGYTYMAGTMQCYSSIYYDQ